MLTEDQRNGIIDTAFRWPNKVVPYVIDSVFSEYNNTNLQTALRAWREISMHYEYHFSSCRHWRFTGRGNGDS